MSEKGVEAPVANSFRKDSKRYFNASRDQLNSWTQERTIPAERRARAAIVGEMTVDGALNQMRDLVNYLKGGFTSVEDGPLITGSPSATAINNMEAVLKDKGFGISGPAEITIQGADSVTGEVVMTTVGRDEEEGHMIYFGEEKNAKGEVISRAVVDTGHSYETATENENGYKYRLEMHYKGGRYAESGAEVDIDSASSPRATAKTLELLTNVVAKSLKT